MKRLFYIIIFSLLALTSCKKEQIQTPSQMICGEWESTQLAIEAKIYASFNTDGSFDLYQQIGEGAYRLYEGTWNMTGSVISGKYDDNTAWSSSYSIVFNNNVMIWKSENETAEESQYIRATIPTSIKETCIKY